MVWDGQYGITWFWVIKDHMTPFLADELITNFTESLDRRATGDIGKCSHFYNFTRLRQVCLQNIPEQVRPGYANPFLWQRESIHEWLRVYYEAHPLWSCLETCSQGAWGIRQHNLGNRSHMLIQREISFLSPPLQSIACLPDYVKHTASAFRQAHFGGRVKVTRSSACPVRCLLSNGAGFPPSPKKNFIVDTLRRTGSLRECLRNIPQPKGCDYRDTNPVVAGFSLRKNIERALKCAIPAQ